MTPFAQLPSADGVWTDLRLAPEALGEASTAVDDAAIVVQNGHIVWVGERRALPAEHARAPQHNGRHALVTPGLLYLVSQEAPSRALLAAGAAQAAAVPAAAAKPRVSICVLPFSNMSGDLEQEYFSDGISEDIITELSRFHSLFVIARNSTFTYKGKE